MRDEKMSLCLEKVFSTVFNEYSKTLYNFLFYKCGESERAKDLTQDAFMKLWQNCKSVSFSKSKGYLFKTANNTLLNMYQHEKVKLKFNKLKTKDYTHENPEYLMEAKEWQKEIEKAISNLPEKQRIVFLLSRIDKKTYREIAEILDISKQAVEKRIYNALNTLRKVNKNIK